MNEQVSIECKNWPNDPLKIRHILSLSGGKDSAALAVYLRDRVPRMEYIFHDTDKELPDTYEYLDRLEGYLPHLGQHLTIYSGSMVECSHQITGVGAPE